MQENYNLYLEPEIDKYKQILGKFNLKLSTA